MHNDVSARRMVNNVDDLGDQPGTKDRLFEDKMEVTWDKGSSGLVFYTDAQYWKEMESHEVINSLKCNVFTKVRNFLTSQILFCEV